MSGNSVTGSEPAESFRYAVFFRSDVKWDVYRIECTNCEKKNDIASDDLHNREHCINCGTTLGHHRDDLTDQRGFDQPRSLHTESDRLGGDDSV